MKSNSAFAAAALGMLLAPSAFADFVVRVHNQSKVEAKAMVQNNPPIMWLKRGQVSDIRLRGKWIKDIKGEYIVNFQNLANAGHQYCVWKVHVLAPSSSKEVKLDVKLEQSDPAFRCKVSGQFTAPEDRSAALDFSLWSK